MRVVTTFPAATEIVTALGVDPVGVSHSCDHPDRVTTRPTVTASRIDGAGPSSSINEAVADLADGSVYEVDGEAIDALEPDVVVTQGMCAVCAVDRQTVETTLDAADASVEPTFVTLAPECLSDVLDDVERVGAALGRDREAAALLTSLEARIDSIQPGSTRPRVAIFDWLDPVMVAGHWTADLVEAAGGRYDLAGPGVPSRPRQWSEITAYDPEVLVLAPCGFDRDRASAEHDRIAAQPGYEKLTAVKEDRVWALDGDQHLNRPGPRLVDTLELLAAIVRDEDPADPIHCVRL